MALQRLDEAEPLLREAVEGRREVKKGDKSHGWLVLPTPLKINRSPQKGTI